jgi:hypothetical protein
VIKDAQHITRLKSIPDLFAELGLRIEAAPDVEDFVENHRDEIVTTVDDELNQWGLQVDDVDDAEIEQSDVTDVQFVDIRTFRTAGEGNDILVVGKMVLEVHLKYHDPDWDTATYDSEDKVLLPHHTVSGEKDVNVEINFSMTLKVDASGKPKSVAKFSFDSDDFIWVSIGPNEYDYK